MSDAINPDHYKQLPVEAIEIIEAMIAGAPDNKAAYLHGQAAKYDLRLWRKGESLEDYLADLGEHIWYALRLESHLLELIEKQKSDEQQKAADLQSLKDHPFGKLKEPVIKQSLNTEPPDGWRWLEVGEVLRRSDATFNSNGSLYELNQEKAGRTVTAPNIFIRRNRFEVGEKVVRVSGECVYKITAILDGGYYEMQTPSGYKVCLYAIDLAPYIEDAK